jgi:hypothetical protein
MGKRYGHAIKLFVVPHPCLQRAFQCGLGTTLKCKEGQPYFTTIKNTLSVITNYLQVDMKIDSSDVRNGAFSFATN